MYEYLCHFLLGGIIFSLLFHFSKKKQEWAAAILVVDFADEVDWNRGEDFEVVSV